MKLSGRQAQGYFARPEPDLTGALIYGADGMRVALKRQDLLKNLLGPEAEAEMRLTRLAASDLKSDPAALLDATKAQGFFPGPRAVFVEGASDGLLGAFRSALEDWQPGDAQVIATAGALKATSKLRKLFEAHPKTYAIGIYDDPPGREEIEATLRAANLTVGDRVAMQDIEALARALDPGDFRQTIEKLSLYKLHDPSGVTPEDVAAVAPLSVEGAVDDVINIVAEARAQDIGPVLRRLTAQGIGATTLCIGATRHLRTLHAAASDPGGPSAGIARARPPIYGPRRDRMQRQASQWGAAKLEEALRMLLDTDLQLRSASQAPQMAVMERTLIRLAMMAGRQ
ncbi:MAG: DNA polymerase III subunit delta [Pseudomonadota bacterium]